MRHVAVVGLGYVGLGLAVALSRELKVTGYDISEPRIKALREGMDANGLESRESLAEARVAYTTSLEDIRDADFYIVTVSTPAWYYEMPDLEPLIKATRQLASVLKRGDIVVYESTVYPGVTEEVALPLLESISGLVCGVDFGLGYSPERISPGDMVHTLKSVPKVVSAGDARTLEIVKEVYQVCCDTLYPVSNIKTAEAVKILENTQRDINIAMMNEFSQIMHALHLDVHEIIEAAKSKWSFVHFTPGFVGGHCIAVDPLYLAFNAKRLGVPHDLIVTARKVNDNMTRFVLDELLRCLRRHELPISKCRIGVFGVTYKPDTPDVRNSLALKFIKELKLTHLHVDVHDPLADATLMEERYGITLKSFEDMEDLTLAVLVTGHQFYKEKGLEPFLKKLNTPMLFMDIPSMFSDASRAFPSLEYWSL